MSTLRTQSPNPFRTQKRRRHQKSRNGCLECKRRRIKCDEAKPLCTRCNLGLHKCIYPEAPSSEDKEQDVLSLPTPPASKQSLSPSTASQSGLSPYLEAPLVSAPMSAQAETTPSHLSSESADNCAQPPSDTVLTQHYLQHTSRTLTYSRKDQGALQIGIPILASRSKTVFHSLLAVSAACMCCDIISKDPSSDISAVTQIMDVGYRHYNLASEGIRGLLSGPEALQSEPLLASATLLIPFATATQQIKHWMSSRNVTHEVNKLLSTTPRDVIVVIRGLRTTLQALERSNKDHQNESAGETDSLMDESALFDFAIQPVVPPPSHTHAMFSIIAATSQGAFSKLHKRIETVSLRYIDAYNEHYLHDSLPACSATFNILNAIRINTISTSKFCTTTSLADSAQHPIEHDSVSLPDVAPWLRSFTCRPAIPKAAEPLTRPLLAFLVQAPQTYLDLVVPLLDQRLESPISSSPEYMPAVLTWEQALALDIYAHWSVLMFLVEDESWWIGQLPTITLDGMINRYGDDFVARLWPDCELEREDWWPQSMLTILKQVKRHSTN